MKKLCLISLVLILANYCFADNSATNNSSCIECHSRGYKGFDKWQASAHGHYNIGCEKCHGGRYDLDSKEAAHAPMLKSNNLMSPLHKNNLPLTCQQCHAEATEGYNSSMHWESLLEGRKAPTCINCHGTNGEKQLTDNNVKNFCASCHKNDYFQELNDAEEALFYIAKMKEKQTFFEQQITQLKAINKDVTNLERAYEVLKSRYRLALKQFHANRYDLAKRKAEFVIAQIAVVDTEINKLTD